MKVYSYLHIDSYANCYLVVNELSKQALVIDPSAVSEHMVEKIEKDKLQLIAVLLTHNHESHARGLSTLKKIYDFDVYSADSELAKKGANVITGDGAITLAGMMISYYKVPGHSADSLVYKIGNVLFTGDTLFAGYLGTTNNSYAARMLKNNIMSKLLSQSNDTIIMPGHGPISTVEVEKEFNFDIVGKVERDDEKEIAAGEVFKKSLAEKGWFEPPHYSNT